ncbi:AraC family transcriptional regulator [Bradyrhizobium sp. NAS80.1]|uniref:AraC family transcriptional regulator n=1 Tax=Bradyrhizobium sp. NAS80.1 TaxID=1680159 RepID=UPI00143D19FF|nr:AraC family transcriptional regulator [Bradyrhizobium sp. NAS80.1]
MTGVANALAAEQLDAPELFRDSGLDITMLGDPDARFPTEQVSLLWELAVARSGNPAVGLIGAGGAKPGYFGVVAYPLMSAPDLLGILHRIVRYIAIVSDAAIVSLHKHGDSYRLALVLNAGSRSVPHERFAFDLLQFLSFCRWVTGIDLNPVGVELSHRGDSSAVFEAAFGCRPRFGAAENAILFSCANVNRPLPTAHPRLSAVHDRIATEQLERVSGSQFTPRARAEIVRCLHDGAPTRAAIARALAVSERTLHRRLNEEGTSFQRLVDDTRRELAENYLARRDLSAAEVAYLLGFKDQGSFFRATQRWFSMTPQNYRLRAASAAE